MRIAPADVFHARFTALGASLAEKQLDALLVTNLTNVAYLTGLFASAAAAIVSSGGITLIGDGRYAEPLAARARDCEFLTTQLLMTGEPYDSAIIRTLATFSAARIGFEAAHLTVSRYNFVTAALARTGATATLVETDGLIEQARSRKDAWEIATLREGAGRLSEVAKCILPKALAGRTEMEVAVDIDAGLRRAGFERSAFDTIVASGPNAARPHARAGDRRIERGDLVVIDFGGVLDGYCTDLTRTVTAGAGGERERRLIEQVTEAQAAAFATIRPGTRPEAVDAAARDTLNRHGVGHAFTHGTGHGLGLDVHEAPRVSAGRPAHADPPLEAGMVMTLEPGAYFPGWGGVRIEDDVLVTASGAEWLTDVPRFFQEGS